MTPFGRVLATPGKQGLLMDPNRGRIPHKQACVLTAVVHYGQGVVWPDPGVRPLDFSYRIVSYARTRTRVGYIGHSTHRSG